MQYSALSSLSAHYGAINASADTQEESNLLYVLCVQLGRGLSVQLNCHRVL